MMEFANGNVVMKDSMSPTSLSPKTFSPSKGTPKSSSTLDNASLDELDRIMDTLSTLSRETSVARDRNDNKRFITSPSRILENPGQRSFTPSENTTPFSATSPEHSYSTATSPSMPPPMTSPPRTPVAQSPRHYVSHPKVMTLATVPSSNASYHHLNEGRSPATIPRLPNNPYENTSILHGSHFVRPSTTVSNDNPVTSSFSNPTVDSPLVVRTLHGDEQSNFFFGPLPVSPEEGSEQFPPPPTGPKPLSMIPSSSGASGYNPTPQQTHYVQSQPAGIPPRSPATGPRHRSIADSGTGRGFDRRPRPRDNQESLTLPAYNEKRSYLKNLEDCTLPRPRVDSSRNDTPHSLPSNAARILNGRPKNSSSEDASDPFSKLSLRRTSNKSSRRANGKFGLQNLSKTPSRRSSSSFNSFDLGRGYASVSTAPASTHGLIHNEVLPHRRIEPKPSPLANEPPEPTKDEKDEGNCCVRSGRFLYSHILEMFILVAFGAGLPIGIVLQATAFHTSSAFKIYFTFWGSTMLPAVLSTITPLLVISSMLTGIANLTPNVIKRLSFFVTLYYLVSMGTAACVAIAFALVIKPGAAVASLTEVGDASQGQNASQTTEEMNWPDAFKLAELGYLRDDGLSAFALKPESYFYMTSQATGITTSDEILRLIRFFFPGCGLPSQQNETMCNLFVLVLLAAVMGIGASSMGVEGSSIRHVIAQIGMVMSKMADLIMWYLPIGILFYVAEMVATKIDWANIGHDRPPPTGRSNGSDPMDLSRVYQFNNATKWYFVTVISSLGVYSLVLMPLVVSILTLTNPFSLLGFRSLGPLLTATTAGFSDLCIPMTARCLIKERHSSGCCQPHAKLDRRINRVIAVLGGLFHRGGSAIVVICSCIFILQIRGDEISILSAFLIGLSAMVTSVTSLGGRWFYGTDPFMRAVVIGLSSAGITSPSLIPRAVLYLWLITRFAALADTIIDLLGAHLLHRVCKSHLRDVAVEQDSRDGNSTASANPDAKASMMVTPLKKTDPVRSVSGETSDYEDAPLLFNRLISTSMLGPKGGRPMYPVVPYDNDPQWHTVNTAPS